MAEFLPPWIYELVAAIEKYEDEHAKGTPCIGGLLELVPEAELERARTIAYYRQTQRAEGQTQ